MTEPQFRKLVNLSEINLHPLVPLVGILDLSCVSNTSARFHLLTSYHKRQRMEKHLQKLLVTRGLPKSRVRDPIDTCLVAKLWWNTSQTERVQR